MYVKLFVDIKALTSSLNVEYTLQNIGKKFVTCKYRMSMMNLFFY